MLEFKVIGVVLVANNLDRIDILPVDRELSNNLFIIVVIELKERRADLTIERFIV